MFQISEQLEEIFFIGTIGRTISILLLFERYNYTLIERKNVEPKTQNGNLKKIRLLSRNIKWKSQFFLNYRFVF